MSKMKELAVNGGKKAIDFAMKGREQFDQAEREAALRLFDASISSGNAFGYNGPEEEAFGKEFAEFLGGGYADGVNSGTNAVYVALKALDLPPFSEVVVGAVTDPGGIMPIVITNCIPMVADAMPGCYNSGPAEIEAVITPLTKAIVIAHIGGEPADILGIMKVAAKYNLPVIEDCAQSHGAKVNGQYVGTFGSYGSFSLMFGKHFCTGGQGGAVFCKTEELYWKERRAADRGKPFGLTNSKGNVTPALNCNLDELGAAIGRAQLKKLPSIIARRQKFVAMLIERGLGKLAGITIPEIIAGGEHVYWWWRLRVNSDKITVSKADYCAALMAEGIPLSPNYSAALPTTFEWFQNRQEKFPWNNPSYKGDLRREFPCPNASAAMENHFNLTISESWGEKEADALMEAFKKVDEAFRK
ncbi:MAG: DegT/DnrJ/EryC1/StrS family aminotransferase [Victivallaceae bacterium]|nr:DegT/DnrJ/EryC1/StrS family aminotransferase [Victivallaceae bacterium]